MNCSCHQARCSRCDRCSTCAWTCTPIVRNGRRRCVVSTYRNHRKPEDPKRALSSILKPKVLQSWTNNRKALGINMNLRRGMKSFSDCTSRIVDEFDAESKGRLILFVVSTISQFCTFICLKDPATLARLCAKNIACGYSTMDAMLQRILKTVIKVLPSKWL